MEIALIILSFLMVSFALLAVFDGLYLHIVRFELHRHKESKLEHVSHTLRAIIFPAMVYFLFVAQDNVIFFYVGLALVAADIVVLGVDAYMEKDSRTFMGGLPRWEYILHLFVNGFHFASIAVFLVIKLQITEDGLTITPTLYQYENFKIFHLIVTNLIPGGILLALLHVFIIFPATAKVWNNFRDRIKCCKMQWTNSI